MYVSYVCSIVYHVDSWLVTTSIIQCQINSFGYKLISVFVPATCFNEIIMVYVLIYLAAAWYLSLFLPAILMILIYLAVSFYCPKLDKIYIVASQLCVWYLDEIWRDALHFVAYWWNNFQIARIHETIIIV